MYDDDVQMRDRPTYDRPESAANTEAVEEYKIFVGGLSYQTNTSSLEAAFAPYGTVKQTQVIYDREGRSKGFGFVTFADEKGMQESISRMNNSEVDGRTVTVTRATNNKERDREHRGYDRSYDRDGRPARYEPSGGAGGYAPRRDYGAREGGYDRPQKPMGFRVSINGLPAHFTWRELKDFLRNAGGEVTYADVKSQGFGIGEFSSAAERTEAIRQLDGKDVDGCVISLRPLEPREGRFPGGGYSDRGGYSGGRGRGGYQSDTGRGGYRSSYPSRGGYSGGDRGYADRGYSSRGGDGSSYGGSYGGSGRERYDSGYGGGREGGYAASAPRHEGGYAPRSGGARYDDRYDSGAAGGGGGYKGGHGSGYSDRYPSQQYDSGYGGGGAAPSGGYASGGYSGGGSGGAHRSGGGGYDRSDTGRRSYSDYDGAAGRGGPERSYPAAQRTYERAAPY